MKKRGFTLIELISLMAAAAAIVGFAAMLLVQLFLFQQNNDGYTQGVRSANRLADDFRNDVQAFGKPEILMGQETLLRWVLLRGNEESGMIEYTTEPGRFPEQLNLVRTMSKDGQQVHRETYRFPSRVSLQFVEGQEDNTGLIALSLLMMPQGPAVDISEFNPFDRTLPKSLEQRVDVKHAGHWRTIVVRY